VPLGPWFQSHPELVDRLESVLTKFYLEGEGAEWQAIWDQVKALLPDRRQHGAVAGAAGEGGSRLIGASWS
jgi:hypothetical protein